MLISELIAELEKIKAEHGDLVAATSPEEYSAEPVWRVTVEKMNSRPWCGTIVSFGAGFSQGLTAVSAKPPEYAVIK